MTTAPELIGNDNYETKFGFHDDEAAFFKANPGLSPEVVATISEMKDEPQWMRDFRLRALEYLLQEGRPGLGQRTPQGDRLRQDPLLRPRHRPRRALVGRRPGLHPQHVR